ncbi:ribonuclease E activity regulator RraA [Rheinheimera aquimaris]|jgi:regulator of ribonuclease activity A|uniref:ribonuclease E activity regulator RraA n=1 Tax=Rheinheimera aquimaris TaxID=412437 RepID=UPI000E862BF7|nr:putative 4-hydroxy-4-methyl-2-oxoglutarate aldolase [Rheinheimera sp.]|tara:strand:- start:967 stop:1449 length:483 start_codon:yes stop_codon:yes gene_type:complete
MQPFTLPDLCDAHAACIRVAEPIFHNYGGKAAFGGQIVTVKCFEDNSKVKQLVATPGQGKVLVVDGGGSKRHALLGDMLAEQAAQNGWEGIIINGCIRDIDEIRQTPLGVQALGIHPMKTDKRDLGDINLTITFAGVDFIPGQYVYADNNGVLVATKQLV